MSLSNPTIVKAANKLQLKISDSISIYSEKAYRRDGGSYFEAVGNVVISSGKDTLYGEKASFNTSSGLLEIEGSVRYIGQEITIYGSKITYNLISGVLQMVNARMITPEFSMVTSYLERNKDTKYYATDAEFTTCKDCVESWQISGKKIEVEMGQYVKIKHALVKVKGVDVFYLPYIALPIKNKRESGVLFPNIYSNSDGIIYEQPFYWAINNSKDMTITPTFLSSRGYGVELQYRQSFGNKRWFEINHKSVMDSLYYPNSPQEDLNDDAYFRHFYEIENHQQWSNSTTQHLRMLGTKDLDFQRNFSYYTEELSTGTDLGVEFFIDHRFNKFNIGLETEFKRNLLVSDTTEFDTDYVQTFPSVNFAMLPIMLWQWKGDYFFKLAMGVDGNITTFRQDKVNESGKIRNVHRLDGSPYLDLNLLNLGPISLKTKYQIDYQEYRFFTEDQKMFSKHASLVSTELRFMFNRIFGLAYREEYDSTEISDKDFSKITDKVNLKKTNVLGGHIIGKLGKVEDSIIQEKIIVSKNSYRHSQEYKFILHQLVHTNESGNESFENQIAEEDGWFDYRDSIVKDLLTVNSTETRQALPLKNTLEFQWNNVLVRKTIKQSNYLIDNKYLKDNYSYSKIGYLNISQGLLLDNERMTFEEKLTRLHLETSYSATTWNISLSDYYIHQSKDHILTISGQKRLQRLSLLSQYNLNSFTSLKTLKTGFQFRPIDILGFSSLREYDLDADENISSIYQVDFMPNNNCWIININYTDSFIEHRYAINFEFNFGSDEFKNYRNNFFNYSRIQ